jgi:proprotein convertase subtilisin/kexin type 2
MFRYFLSFLQELFVNYRDTFPSHISRFAVAMYLTISFFFGCYLLEDKSKKEKEKENALLLGVAAIASKPSSPFTVSGTVYYSGVVKNAALEVRRVGSAGGCSPTENGDLVKSVDIDEKGSFTVTLPALGFACYLVVPKDNSRYLEVNSAATGKEKAWIKNEATVPYLSAISTDTSNLNITPLTRFASARFQSLKKAGSSDTLALEKANKEIAAIFFPDEASTVSNITINSLDFQKNLLQPTEKLYLLVLQSFSDYIYNLGVDTNADGVLEPTLPDYEAVYSAYSKDLSDGRPNGTYFTNKAFESIQFTGSNSRVYSLSTLTVDIKPFFDNIARTNSAYSSLLSKRFCSYTNSSGACQNTACQYSGGTQDPFFSYQWHLSNTGQLGGVAGEDIRLGSVHSSNRGEGILAYVVDDGLEITHEDLLENIVGGSVNVLKSASDSSVTDPGSNEPSHGTSVGGLIAARALNGIGVSGVAPCAGIAGYNLLQDYTTENEITAMSGNKAIFVSNNSWGAPDSTGQIAAASSTWKAAVEDGLANARGGKGTVYVWASGNGGVPDSSPNEIDNSNYDGQANFYGVVAVSAIGNNGKRASYSDNGANVWITTYSQGKNGGGTDTAITTTDLTGSAGFSSSSTLGNNNYTNTFNGTSASAPVVTGGIALIFRENPNLTWRDIKLLLAKSARKNDPTDTDWKTNLAGYNVSHKYGFGSMDVNAAVNMAKTWTSVGGSESLRFYPSKTTYQTSSPGLNIPDNSATGISSSIVVSGSGVSKIEFIEVRVNISHTYTGDLKIELQRNGSSVSDVLAAKHSCYASSSSTQLVRCDPYNNWVFGTTRHLDEAGDGTWTLKVIDLEAKDTGKLESWGLKFIGR